MNKLDVVFVDGGHRYWSAQCRHSQHDTCPPRCPNCGATCRCGCHCSCVGTFPDADCPQHGVLDLLRGEGHT